MKYENLQLRSLMFFALVVLTTILAFTVFSKYLNLIVISFIIVQVFQPIYKFLKDKLRSSAVATALSVVLVLLFVIVPLIIILVLILSEIQTLASSTSFLSNIGNLEEIVNGFISRVNEFFNHSQLALTISEVRFTTIIEQLDKSALVRDQLIPLVGGIASLSGEIIFTLFLIILSLIYIFPGYDKIPQAISKISPFDNDIDQLFIRRFKDTIKGVVKGTLVVAILQSTAVIIPFLALQIGAPALLWILMVVLSIIPIGSGLVWGPVSLALILNGISTGNPLGILLGIALFVYSGIIINVIDTTIRPRLMKNAVNLHPLVTIFSVLGGIGIFGFMGILYGPLIIVFFLTVMEVYRTKYLGKEYAELL